MHRTVVCNPRKAVGRWEVRLGGKGGVIKLIISFPLSLPVTNMASTASSTCTA